MKPLDLTNYGPFKEGPNGSRIFHGPHKRLTDAELSAEYWRNDAYSRVFKARPNRWAQWGEVLARFATHPHYDEADQ